MKKIKEFTPDFLNIPYVVMDMQPADRFVFGAIYMFSQLSQKICTASNVALGKIAKVSPESVSNSLVRLEEKGFIKRHFKDNNKRTRDHIQCLVGYVKIPSTNGSDTIARLDKIPSTDEQIKNIYKEENITTPEEFSSEDYFKSLINHKDRKLQIIAIFALKKKKYLEFKDKKSANAFVFSGRNLSVAKKLTGFTDKQILDGMRKASEITINGREINWGLETVEKQITK